MEQSKDGWNWSITRRDRSIYELGVCVGTVVEGVMLRELAVSFEAQDVSNCGADACTDVADDLKKRM